MKNKNVDSTNDYMRLNLEIERNKTECWTFTGVFEAELGNWQWTYEMLTLQRIIWSWTWKLTMDLWNVDLTQQRIIWSWTWKLTMDLWNVDLTEDYLKLNSETWLWTHEMLTLQRIIWSWTQKLNYGLMKCWPYTGLIEAELRNYGNRNGMEQIWGYWNTKQQEHIAILQNLYWLKKIRLAIDRSIDIYALCLVIGLGLPKKGWPEFNISACLCLGLQCCWSPQCCDPRHTARKI